MPRDGAPTRAAILSAAVQTLKRSGLEGFSIDAVAQRAGVVKGLVLYHFQSRSRLLKRCGEEVAAERRRRLAPALAADADLTAIDGTWAELVAQASDGTSRAWLALCSADAGTEQAAAGSLETRARQAVLDGCAVALVAGGDRRTIQDAYTALWVALLAVEARA
ncbi:MAG TPA: TetR/AcrR family transcriptional regulator [Gemmatimonadaceae bacterium]